MVSTQQTHVLNQDVSWADDQPKLQNYTSAASGASIGDLAKEFSVTLRALRFYESKGLIKPRRTGSARIYSEEDRNRLVLILQGKRLGFTLVEIRALLASQGGEAAPQPLRLSRQQCVEQIRLLEQQKRDLEEAIGELRRTYSSLYASSFGLDGILPTS